MKINELCEEGKISLPVLITRCEIGRTNKNLPYLSLTLEDKTGVLDAKFWNLTEEQAAKWQAGQIVEATGDLIRYRNAWQLRVRTLEETEGDVMDFVQAAPMSRAEMEAKVSELVDQIENPIIQDLTREMIDMKREDFFSYPAAVRNHHAYPGGLAWHSLSMVALALNIVDLYPFLDRDLMIAGILLHDIAKTEEYSQALLPEYTSAGNLIGHISMGAMLLDRVAVALDIEDKEEVMLLKHMVLSHHGRTDFGSPVVPMTAEAEVLSQIDNLDSKLNMIEQNLLAVEPGKFGPRTFALENRMFYRKSWDDVNGRPVPKTEMESDKTDEAALSQTEPEIKE